ncbi:hypothetical protein HPB51_021189 [Rhipicephalus microplus]|uniref:Uncharacterized protein n=1 Tax=Rhipicephalus microplus TaxID=6941 RepID=A0A9J6F676_RHIMP|nr:hypothetical protein HPB51_021189 [Rhipicephalus microplus]
MAEQSSGASDIAGVFAAQVAAAAAASSSGPPQTKVSLPPVLEPPPPPPLVEEVSPHEEEVTAPVEERREACASPTPPPTRRRNPAWLLTASVDVEAPLPTGDAESAVLAEEVVDTQNNADASAEGRTPVVVEEVAPAAVVTRAAKKDAEETPAVPSKTPTSVAPSHRRQKLCERRQMVSACFCSIRGRSEERVVAPHRHFCDCILADNGTLRGHTH